jgi:hypothetical protein
MTFWTPDTFTEGEGEDTEAEIETEDWDAHG